MSWTPGATWEDLNTTEGDWSLDANKFSNNLGQLMDSLAVVAMDINSKLTPAILDIKSSFDDAVDTYTTTYAVVLNGSPYSPADISFSLPVLPAKPNMTALGTQAAAPSAPSPDVRLLDEAAYTGAFALAREAAEQEAIQALWEVGAGAAAGGVGMPYAAKLGAVDQVAQKRAQAIQTAALTQATKMADDLSRDKKWAYEQQLVYWVQVHASLLDWWTKENTLRTTIWIQEAKAKQDQFASELTGIAMRLKQQEVAFQYWEAVNKNELEKADKIAADARAVQALIVATAEKAIFAYAGALAEQLKAYLQAVNYSLSASASPTNASYAGA